MSSKDESSKDSVKSDIEIVKEHLSRFGHVYPLVVILVFTLVTRIQGYKSIKKDGSWLFVGNDGWYHFRATMFNTENYPFQIGFDAKSGYPVGSEPGTFGTFYNLVHSTISMILGLGDPDPEIVRTVLVFSSPVLSVLTVIATYYLAKYITESKGAGVFSALVLALIPGTFYSRGVVGFAQHHIMETLLLVLSVYFVMRAIQKAEEDYIIGEVIRNGEFEEYKDWLKLVGLATLFIFLYYETWPPAIMLFGLIGISGVLYALIGFSNNRTQPGLLTFVLLSVATTVMVLINIPNEGFGIAKPSLLHLGITVATSTFLLICWIGLRYSNKNNISFRKYGGSIIGFGLVSVISAFILQPSLVDSLSGQVLRLLGFPFGIGDGSGGVQTIAEERSSSLLELTFQQYGLTLPLAIFGLVILTLAIGRARSENKNFGMNLFFVIVATFLLIISIRTIRFNYYLAPFVAILAAVAIVELAEFVDIPNTLSGVKGYHIVGAFLVVFMVIPVLLVPVQGGGVVYDQAVGEGSTVSYQDWSEPLEWMSENTPEDGVSQYESINRPYDYPEESYGVMSWWDYGHWITVTGERTPIANPFQQNARNAAEFMLAQSPEEAEKVMSDIKEGSEAKYIMIDWQMASPFSKFSAMEAWHPDLEQGDSYTPYYATPPGESAQIQFFQRNQNYYESMLGRLYVGHGSAMEASRNTIDYDALQSVRTIQPATSPITTHSSLEEAVNYTDSQSQVSRGGLSNPPERVDALENYRLIKVSSSGSISKRPISYELRSIRGSSNTSILNFVNDVPSSVKLFERVEGAEIEGSGAEPNSTMNLEVDVRVPSLGSQFTYTQRVTTDSDGEFKAVVPYSNTGYDQVEYPPAVRGSSQYRLTNSTGDVVLEFNVPEKNVKGEEGPIQVEVDS